jgi:hypothetical protein
LRKNQSQPKTKSLHQFESSFIITAQHLFNETQEPSEPTPPPSQTAAAKPSPSPLLVHHCPTIIATPDHHRHHCQTITSLLHQTATYAQYYHHQA